MVNPFTYLGYAFELLAYWFLLVGDWCQNMFIVQPLAKWFGSLSQSCTLTSNNLKSNAYAWDTLLASAADILSWDNLKALLLEWLPGLADLGTWISTWAYNVQVVIDSWWDGAEDLVLGLLATLHETIDAELKGLLSHDYFNAWWGDVSGTFGDWWATQVVILSETIEAVIKPVRDVVNEHSVAISLLTDPGDTALRWFWDRLISAIVRLW